jgi:hypothetical protein
LNSVAGCGNIVRLEAGLLASKMKEKGRRLLAIIEKEVELWLSVHIVVKRLPSGATARGPTKRRPVLFAPTCKR